MKRFSITLLFMIGIIGGFGAIDYFVNLRAWVDSYREIYAQNVAKLTDEMVLAKGIFDVRQNMDEVVPFLESRERSSAINFWAILHNEGIYKTNISSSELENFNVVLTEPGSIKLEKDHAYVIDDLGYGFKLMIGLRYNQEAFIAKLYAKSANSLIIYFIGIAAVAFLSFSYFFRDIMKSIRSLSTKNGRSFGAIKTKSREAELIARGLAAYEGHSAELEKERDVFRSQVLPSLRTELTSGRKPPYDFECTLVRTDINNFTKIYNGHSVDEFTATINDFFTEVSHIVSRYGGLVHEFIGDEVIFYFKDDDVGNSVAVALSAIRDINEAAARFHTMTMRDRGYPFTVKSTLAHDRIRFRNFVNGFNLAGPSLIETVRVLSHITEKDESVIVFDKRHMARLGEFIQAQPYATVLLKGFARNAELVVYRGHAPITKYLSDDILSHLGTLRFYRSDRDLEDLVHWAREKAAEGRHLTVSQIVGVLRQVRVTLSQGGPENALRAWVEELLANPEMEENLVRTKASAIRLIENIVPAQSFDAVWEKLLERATQINDRRIIANALDVLTFFKKDADPGFTLRLIGHNDNRVAANALVHEGMTALSPKVINSLRKMLKSQKPVWMSSALYAIGELANYHRRQDPIYFETQISFQELIQSLPKYVIHEDIMVRRQSLIAARKSGHPEIVDEIWSTLAASGSAEFIREAHQHLGHQVDSSQTKTAA